MVSSRTQVPISPRVRYGRSSGTMRLGASAYSRCVPSSFELDTIPRRTPALRRIAIASFAESCSHASWL